MIRLLSSMRFAWWSLAALIIWLMLGVVLTVHGPFHESLKTLSDVLVLDWLLDQSRRHPLLLSWFAVLCGLSAALLLCAACCLWTRLLSRLAVSFSLRGLVLLSVHLFFIIVMLCHTAGMMAGYKHSGIRLLPGESFTFADGYRLTLSEVTFTDDLAILRAEYKEARKLMTRDNFHYKRNLARLHLAYLDEPIARGDVRMLKPLRHGALRITLRGFFLSGPASEPRIGVRLVIMENPLVDFFFIMYACLILSMLLFLFLTRRPGMNSASSRPPAAPVHEPPRSPAG
jgi:hypothetical protein